MPNLDASILAVSLSPSQYRFILTVMQSIGNKFYSVVRAISLEMVESPVVEVYLYECPWRDN